jgi:hypothetical protein
MLYDVSKSFQTGHLEQELQMVQLSATKRSCIAILWISLVSFATITLCVASQQVFIVVSLYFIIDSVWKLLGVPSYMPSVFKTRASSIGWRKLDTFLGGRPRVLILCSNSTLLIQLKPGPTKGRKAMKVRSSLALSYFWGGLRAPWYISRGRAQH